MAARSPQLTSCTPTGRIIDEKLSNVDKFSAVSDISARDPGTVVIRVKQPTPNLLTNLGGFKGTRTLLAAVPPARPRGLV